MQFIVENSRKNSQLLVKGILILIGSIVVTGFALVAQTEACTYTAPSQTTVQSYTSNAADECKVYNLLQPTTETHCDSVYGSYYNQSYGDRDSSHDSCDNMEQSTIYSCVYKYFSCDNYCYDSTHSCDGHDCDVCEHHDD